MSRTGLVVSRARLNLNCFANGTVSTCLVDAAIATLRIHPIVRSLRAVEMSLKVGRKKT